MPETDHPLKAYPVMRECPIPKPVVVIESPYASPTLEGREANIAYARRALRHSLDAAEAPFAGHLLYTQVLDDDISEQRILGLSSHLSFLRAADTVAFYIDLGVSPGMCLALREAIRVNLFRSWRSFEKDEITLMHLSLRYEYLFGGITPEQLIEFLPQDSTDFLLSLYRELREKASFHYADDSCREWEEGRNYALRANALCRALLEAELVPAADLTKIDNANLV